MDDIKLAYLAGIVDADGYIGLINTFSIDKAHGPTYRPETRGRVYGRRFRQVMRVGVTMTDPTVPTMLKAEFGGTLYCRQRKQGWKNVWAWDARSNKALKFLEAIRPWLLMKTKQADIAIAFQRQRAPHVPRSAADKHMDKMLGKIMTGLNARGTPTEYGTHN
ncbi:hypothetical protein LCGC14_1264120 [marine sediment metagenome]|uniref:Homing endonuclease LAGLIDADG domain-containing protein n=1 Tax=marine sediment metagenome TaxID=412755 RepID=A0A0F9LL55_9ZZZZ